MKTQVFNGYIIGACPKCNKWRVMKYYHPAENCKDIPHFMNKSILEDFLIHQNKKIVKEWIGNYTKVVI